MAVQDSSGNEKQKSGGRNGLYLGVLFVLFVGTMFEMQRRFQIFTEG